MREDMQNAADLQATYYSGILSENPTAAVPISSPATTGRSVKVLSDRYKGMSEEERMTYRSGQLEQVISCTPPRLTLPLTMIPSFVLDFWVCSFYW